MIDVPVFGRRAADSVPPWASTVSLTIVSPSPAPPGWAPRARSPRKNGSVMCGRSVSAMPMPDAALTAVKVVSGLETLG